MVKTITITEEAYTSLKRLKRDDESFSKVILRTTGQGQYLKIKDILGVLGTGDTTEWQNEIKAYRTQFDIDARKRQDALARQLRSN